MRLPIGYKVFVPGREQFGVGEVATYPDEAGSIAVHFFRGPTTFERVVAKQVRRAKLSEQTRCFVPLETGYRIGRIVSCRDGAPHEPLIYYAQFPNANRVEPLKETDFHARSLLGAADPVETLAALAHETPFFFEQRAAWVDAYDRHALANRGLQALDSAAVELFPHQADAVRRILQDPCVRYLLADEVGLGKTIEAGAILRQLARDAPRIKCVVIAPAIMQSQWRKELDHRFGLTRVTVARHEDLESIACDGYEAVVVDEAQRIIGDNVKDEDAPLRFEWLRTICSQAKHLLLLSATPVLHREVELLSLLHLLDPEQYRLDDLEGFQRRIQRRAPIGRSLLALSRATAPLIIQRQLHLLSDHLTDDNILHDELRKGPTGKSPEDTVVWRALAARVRIHVAETWRLHRRMLRTRRSVLVQDGEIRRNRRIAEPEYVSNYLENANAFTSLWEWIEELRIALAARAAELHKTGANRLRHRYLSIAAAAACPSASFVDDLREIERDPDYAFVRRIINEILQAATEISPSSRLEALAALLDAQPDDASHWVVFCGSKTLARKTAAYLADQLGGVSVHCLHSTVASDAQKLINEFTHAQGRSLLIVDKTAEEGINLQVADGLVFLDLPFRPMRLEQRIGRLDRLDRARALTAIAVLSVNDVDDQRLAFDRAWYEVLVNGFGLFEESIADVPYLLERQLDEIGRLVFERGPAALYEYVLTLRQLLETERLTAEEQDIIDGTFAGVVKGSDWWRQLEEADADEEKLAKAFANYIDKSVSLTRHYLGKPIAGTAPVFELRLDKDREVLLPAERISPILRHVKVPFTFGRQRATREPGIELLRPGHPLLDALRTVADWDDRGRSFALWRQVPDWHDSRLIARICVTATLDADVMIEDTQQLDTVALASLRRLAATWFSTWRSEWFLQPDGNNATDEQIFYCQRPYQKKVDHNLGGDRAGALTSLINSVEWPAYCRRMAAGALERTRNEPALQKLLATAHAEAQNYFAQSQVRLRLRENHGLISSSSSELETLKLLRDTVEVLLAKPVYQIDSIGVYVLSADMRWAEAG